MKRTVRTRLAVALSLALLGAVPAMSATPAAADEAAASCQTLLHTTPGIEVDTNNDGNPEFRAPRIYDVVLCSNVSSGYVAYPPEIENCSTQVKVRVDCMAVRITVLPAYANANANGDVCFSIEGFSRECVPFDSGTLNWREPTVMCIGYDLGGGHPCDGGTTLVGFAFE